ncbi:MAG: ThuA domain-containing protein [Bacteroidota bacterium]
MRWKAFIGLFVITIVMSGFTSLPQKSDAILIFTKTEGYRHESIPTGVEALQQLADEHNVATLHTEDASYFQTDSLSRFDAVVFLSTTGDILNDEQQSAFEKFIENGGGFAGIHAAADTEYDWPWYGEMVGAYFDSHPEIQEATVRVTDGTHASTTMLPKEWIRTDEWYNYRDINPDINVLLKLDESTYEGGEHGEDHPIAWYNTVGEARIFYTGGGHTDESFSDDLFRDHLWGGVQYVLKKE